MEVLDESLHTVSTLQMGLYGDSMQASILPIPEIYLKLLYVSSSDEFAMLSEKQ